MELIEGYSPSMELGQERYQESINESINKVFPDGVTPRMTFKEAIGQCLDKYATFKGRARRSEYWWFFLFESLVVLVPLLPLLVVAYLDERAVISLDSGVWSALGLLSLILALIGNLALLLLAIPALSVQVRRLHDIGRSGWWVLWSVVATVICLIVPFFILGTQALDLNEMEQISVAFKTSMVSGALLLAVNASDVMLGLLLLVFSCIDSERGTNKYGPSPKYI